MHSRISPEVPLIEDPVNLDRVIQGMQLALSNGLAWLRYAYGRAYTEREMRDERTYFLPKVYVGNKRYESVLPNKNLESYCFFVVDEPGRVNSGGNAYQGNIDGYQMIVSNHFTYDIGIVFWYNLEKMDFDFTHRYTEELQKEILNLINEDIAFRTAGFVAGDFYWTPQEVFRGYSLDHTKEQTFAQPYAGLRLDGRIYFKQDCP